MQKNPVAERRAGKARSIANRSRSCAEVAIRIPPIFGNSTPVCAPTSWTSTAPVCTATAGVAGMALILGIDRFLSMFRALVNMIGNGVATLVLARWEGELERETLRQHLARLA